MVTKLLSMFQKKKLTDLSNLPFMFWFGSGARLDLNEIEVAFKGWAFTCINKRSTALTSLNWYAGSRQADQTTKELPNEHWLNQLLNEPNPYMTFTEMLDFTVKWLDATGNMFWLKYMNGSQILGLLPIIPTTVNLEYSNNLLTGYSINGKFYSKDEVIHFKHLVPSLNPDSIILGTSLVKIAMDSIVSNSELNQYLNVFFKNEGLPPLIAYLDDVELSEEQKATFKDSWQSRLPNNQLAAMIDKRISIEPLNVGGANQGTASIIPQLDDINKKNISTVFGVPPGLLTGEQQNRSVSETNLRSFMLDTINPLAKKISETISKSLGDSNLIVTCDYYMDSNKEFELSALQYGLTSGVITANEYRSFLGYAPMNDITQLESTETTELNIKKKVRI